MKKLVLAVVVLGVIIFAYLKDEGAALDEAPAQAAQSIDGGTKIDASSAQQREKAPAPDSVTDLQNVSAQAEQIVSTRDQQDKRVRWLAQHGYSSDNRTYYLLSDKELEALAESGDVEAIQRIAFKYVGENTEKALAIYRVAAAHDSTSALIAMADFALEDLPDVGDDRAEAVTRGLSFALAALKRGDYMIGPNKVAEFKTRFQVSATVMADACARAVSELDAVERMRTSLGMGYFDQPDPPGGLFSRPATFDSLCAN